MTTQRQFPRPSGHVRTRMANVLVILAVLFSAAGTARAAITIWGGLGNPGSAGHICPEPVWHMCEDRLAPNPVERLTGPSEECKQAMKKYFPDWTVTYNYTQPWNGDLFITKYAAIDAGEGQTKHSPGCIVRRTAGGWTGGMGADLLGMYWPHIHNPLLPGDPPTDDITRFRWIQIVGTSDPSSAGATSPYVDPYGNPAEDDKPFYWMENEYGPNRTPFNFEDVGPRRTCPCPGHKWWRGELYLSDWYKVPGAPKDNHVIIYEGIRWGFDIDCNLALPEPASLILLLPGGLLCLRLRRT
jgi:hypothetical protein